ENRSAFSCLHEAQHNADYRRRRHRIRRAARSRRSPWHRRDARAGANRRRNVENRVAPRERNAACRDRDRSMIFLMMAALSSGHFLVRTVKVDGVAHRYQVWIPPNYDASQKWPAILFLHGSGERGDDGEKQTMVGLGPALREGKVDGPAVIVFPQCPADQRWAGNAWSIAVAALDQAEREWSIDRRRVSLTGISMGGAGVWILAAKYAKRWSAIAPVCGYVHRPPSPPDAEGPTPES